MRSRRTNGLLTVVALVAVAAVAGNAARGTDEFALAGVGTEPVVTVTRTPEPVVVTTDADATRRAAESRAAAAKAGADQAAAAKKAADAKTADAKAAAAKAVEDEAAARAKSATDPNAKSATDPKAKAAAAPWTVTKVVDGDTVWVARDGVSRKIRLIGIDTPESGQCGFTESSRSLRGIIGGQRVRLTAGTRDDADRYGRLLRYVDVNGVDAGLRQIKSGQAVARYDSRDGYGAHARETAYVSADAVSPKAACEQASPAASDGSSGGGSTGAGSTAAWPLAGDRHPCPQSRPVKGNEDSMIAHEPGDRYYGVTNPEQCFASMGSAVAAGFRPAKV